MTETEKAKLIIDRSRLVSTPKRIVAGGITALFWFAWIYLWLPLLTLLAWTVGIHHAYIQLLPSVETEGIMNLAFTYFAIVLGLGITLMVWALSEYLRFRNVRRRIEPTAVGIFELARYADVNPTLLMQWQAARRIVVHHDSNARFRSADIII